VQNPEENILFHAAAAVKTTARPPAVCYRVRINLGITYKPIITTKELTGDETLHQLT